MLDGEKSKLHVAQVYFEFLSQNRPLLCADPLTIFHSVQRFYNWNNLTLKRNADKIAIQ